MSPKGDSNDIGLLALEDVQGISPVPTACMPNMSVAIFSGHSRDSGTWKEAESLGRERVVPQLLLHACSGLGDGCDSEEPFSGLASKGWKRWP